MMEVVKQLEKENGEVCHVPSKMRKTSSSLKSKRLLSLGNAKSCNAPKTQALRRALGDVNLHVPPRELVSAKAKCEDLIKPDKIYPEIETFIPYNPLDYETFDVPEEHKLSDHCLAGVPLFISMDGLERFSALTDFVSPFQEMPINYDAYADSFDASFDASFEDLSIELPLPCDF